MELISATCTGIPYQSRNSSRTCEKILSAQRPSLIVYNVDFAVLHKSTCRKLSAIAALELLAAALALAGLALAAVIGQ